MSSESISRDVKIIDAAVGEISKGLEQLQVSTLGLSNVAGLHQARFRPCQRWDLRFMGTLELDQVG